MKAFMFQSHLATVCYSKNLVFFEYLRHAKIISYMGGEVIACVWLLLYLDSLGSKSCITAHAAHLFEEQWNEASDELFETTVVDC